MPFCMYCGSQEPVEATYCGSCGKRLLTMPATAPKNNTPPHLRSETGNEPSATLTQQKAESHGHFQQKRAHWKWHALFSVN